jgi:CRP-like cAMP-binding protein
MSKSQTGGIPWQELVEQANRLGLAPRSSCYAKRAHIFEQGDPATELYIVCEGWIKLVHLMKDGRPLTLRLLGSGDLFGKSALTGVVRQAYAEVLAPTRLLKLKPQELAQILSDSPDLMLTLLSAQAQEAYEFQTRLLTATRGSLQDELAVLLWFLYRRFGKETPEGVQLEPKLPVRVLADLLGRSRQRVNEALLTFRAKGWIDRHYGQIVIKDLESLRERARPFLELARG